MKVQITESTPGEFAALSEPEKLRRLDEANQQSAHALGIARGGEMQLIVDLAIELGEKYTERQRRFLTDYAALALEADE